MNVGVILAGGVGSRLDSPRPKQFFKVAGKTVLEHTVDAFELNNSIDEIVIVSHPLYMVEVENLVLNNEWRKVKKVIGGGKNRYDSSLAAIYAYQHANPNLIFHDAVRPLVSQRIIDDVAKALTAHHVVDVAIPAVDTIIEVENNYITNVPDRSKLYRGQTPQAFRLDIIKRAYDLALKDPHFVTTDDCSVVKKYLPEEAIFVVAGEEANMKLTYKEDTFLLDKLFQLKSINHLTVANSIAKLKDKVVVIFGASSGIGASLADLCREHGAKVHGFSRSMKDVDITSRQKIKSALKAVHAEQGRIDFIVNTAGVLYKEPLVSMEDVKIQKIIDINYTGMVNVAIESYQYLKESKGHLLFFTSSSYTRGRAFYSLYSSAKAAAVNFVQAIAQEWEHNGIKVNCINPERTKTQMRIDNFGIEPAGTLLTPEFVAMATAQTLLSDFTGQIVDVKQ